MINQLFSSPAIWRVIFHVRQLSAPAIYSVVFRFLHCPDTAFSIAPRAHPDRPLLDLPTPEGWKAELTWVVGCVVSSNRLDGRRTSDRLIVAESELE